MSGKSQSKNSKVKKKLDRVIRIQIPHGAATPAPPVGPALGSCVKNLAAFCKDFNAKTQDLPPGVFTTVDVHVFTDGSYELDILGPPTSVQIMRALGIESGSSKPNSKKVGALSADMVRSIASAKMKYTPAASLEAAERSIIGTARSMGVDVCN